MRSSMTIKIKKGSVPVDVIRQLNTVKEPKLFDVNKHARQNVVKLVATEREHINDAIRTSLMWACLVRLSIKVIRRHGIHH